MKRGMFSWHGTARILFGGLLVVSAYVVNRLWPTPAQSVFQSRDSLLVLSGIAMIASGVLTVTLSGLAEFNDAFGTTYQESIYYYRGIAGNISNTLLGLAVFTMAPTQWKFGRVDETGRRIGILLGPLMLLIWWDAASISHSVSGTGFILWLLLTSVALFIGRRDGAMSEEPTRHLEISDVN